jgi:hypothetical protein
MGRHPKTFTTADMGADIVFRRFGLTSLLMTASQTERACYPNGPSQPIYTPHKANQSDEPRSPLKATRHLH